MIDDVNHMVSGIDYMCVLFLFLHRKLLLSSLKIVCASTSTRLCSFCWIKTGVSARSKVE